MPTRFVCVALFAAVLLHFPVAPAGEPALVSTMGLVEASASHQGFSIVPARDVHPRVYTEDHAPPQVFEIIRPDLRPFSVGRLHASCTCLQVSMEKRDFAQGERALITVRNVKPTIPQGASYAFFVQIDRPFRAALQSDVYMKSEPKGAPAAPPHPAPPQASSPQPPRPNPEPPKPPRFEDIVPYPKRPNQER